MSVNVGKAVAYLDIDTSKFKTGIKTAISDLKSLGDKTQPLSSKIRTVSSMLSKTGKTLTTGVTTPLLAVGTASVKTAFEFEKQMARVKSISGATGNDFKALENKAKEMGATTVFTSLDAAKAMEYMGMAGWKADQMIAGLPGIMDLAAASGEELGTVSDIVTDALTAFGLKAEDTGHFVDVLAAAATNSNTNVSMLGESFKYAAPVAGALGYSVDDVGVALGLMANSGIKASQAGTSLRALFTNLAKPTGESAKAVAALDLSLTKSDGSMKSFKEIMDELRLKFGELKMPQEEVTKKMNELDQALQDGTLSQDEYNEAVEELTKNAFGAADAEKAKYAAMLAGRTGMSGLLAILNTTTEDYDKLTTAIYDCDGASKKMADTQRDTLWGSFELLKSAISAVFQSIGERLIPYIRDLADWLTELVDKFNSLSEEQKDNIVKIGLWIAAAGPILIVVSKILNFINLLATTFGTVGTVVTKVAGLFGKAGTTFSKVGGIISKVATTLGTIFMAHPMIAAIAAIAAAIVALWFKCEWFRDLVSGLVKKAKELPGKIVGFFTDLPNNMAKKFEEVKTSVSGKLKEMNDNIGKKLEETNDSFTRWWDGQREIIDIDKIEVPISNMTDNISEKFKKMAQDSEGSMKDVYESLATASKDAGDVASSMLVTANDLFFNLGQVVGDVVTLQFDKIPEDWKRVWDILGINTDIVKENLGKAFKSFGDVVDGFRDELEFKFTDLMDNVIFGTLFTKTEELGTNVQGWFYGVGQKMTGGLSEAFNGAGDITRGLTTTLESVEMMANDVFGTAGNMLIDFVTLNPGDAFEELKSAIKRFKERDLKGLSEGLEQIKKGAERAFKGLGEAAKEKLKDVGDKIGEVFGIDVSGFFKGAGEKFEGLKTEGGKKLKELGDSISTLNKDISENLPGTFSEVFTKKIPELFEGLGTTVEETVGKIVGFFSQSPEEIGYAIGEAVGEFVNFFADIDENVQQFIETAVSNVVTFFTETIPEKWEEFTGWFDEGIFGFLDNIGQAVIDGISSIGDFFAEIPEKVSEAFESFEEIYTKFNEWWGDVLEDVGYFLGELVANIYLFFTQDLPDIFVKFFTETLPGFLEDVGEFFGKLWDDVVKFGSDLWDDITKWWDDVGKSFDKWKEDIVKKAEKMLENVGKFFSELPGNVKKWLDKTKKNIEKWGEQTVKNISESAKKAIEKAGKFFSELPGKVKKSFDKTVTNVKNWGKNMTKKAKEIAKDFSDNIVKKIKELPGKITEFVKKIPEKLTDLKQTFKDAGSKIMDGLWGGLKETWDGIWKWLGDIKKNVGKFFSGFTQGFNDTVNARQATRSVNGSHAGGLSYVPYDGYVAELHKGERVLTKSENDQYNSGGQVGGDTFVFYNTQPDPYEYYRQMKKAKTEIQYGF